MYEKITIITQIWQGAKCYFKYASETHGTWLLYQIWTKSTHSYSSSLRHHNKHLSVFGHNYTNLAQSYSIWHTSATHGPWFMIPNMKKIQAAIMDEWLRMNWQKVRERQTDILMDRTLSYVPCRVGNNRSLPMNAGWNYIFTKRLPCLHIRS